LKTKAALPDAVNAPDWLSDPAKLAWNELKTAADIALSPADIPAFGLLATLFGMFKDDPVGFGASNVTQLRILLAEYGLTPSGAAKRPPRVEENPFAKIRRNADR